VWRVADTWAGLDDHKRFTYPSPYHSWNPWGNWNISSGLVNTANPAFGTLIPLYSCPADGRTLIAQRVETGHGSSYWDKVALTAYVGVSGLDGSLAAGSRGRSGILYEKARVKMGEITDGTSNTLLVGERPPSKDLVYGWWFAGAGFDDSGEGDVVLGVRSTNYAQNHGCFPPTTWVGLRPGRTTVDCDQVHFWSLHSGGANFLFGDGSTRFVSYNADNILPLLATRHGGEVIPSGF
jgi:prepilin-type processing-associated H-X9-DG protein